MVTFSQKEEKTYSYNDDFQKLFKELIKVFNILSESTPDTINKRQISDLVIDDGPGNSFREWYEGLYEGTRHFGDFVGFIGEYLECNSKRRRYR